MSTGFAGTTRLHSLMDTQKWAQNFAHHLEDGDIVALNGNLGAGKTFLVQNIIAALGSSAEVTSPTFALVNEYQAQARLVFHWDFYRMHVAEEALEIGWKEMLNEPGAIHFVEWADRFPELIPVTAWRISIQSLSENERKLHWSGPRDIVPA